MCHAHHNKLRIPGLEHVVESALSDFPKKERSEEDVRMGQLEAFLSCLHLQKKKHGAVLNTECANFMKKAREVIAFEDAAEDSDIENMESDLQESAEKAWLEDPDKEEIVEEDPDEPEMGFFMERDPGRGVELKAEDLRFIHRLEHPKQSGDGVELPVWALCIMVGVILCLGAMVCGLLIQHFKIELHTHNKLITVDNLSNSFYVASTMS